MHYYVKFQIKLDGTGSEVGINYIIRFENESKKPKNLKFSYDNKTYNSLTELQEVLTGAINADDQDKIKELTIAVKEIAMETKATREDVNDMNSRLKAVEEKPAKNWDKIITTIIGTAVGAVVGAIIGLVIK